MNTIIERFEKIKSNIKLLNPLKPVNIIAVSKTFSLAHIQPLIDYGHIHFGENKVQEASSKWLATKKKLPNLRLHMVGKLQSNKAKNAIETFDYIHSLDNQKLADILSKNEKNLNKNLNYFIQVNIGNEIQKSGINYNDFNDFYNLCKTNDLNVIGTMCIPPDDNKSDLYFSKLKKLNDDNNLNEISMGMSNDYLNAVEQQSTFLRIGSKIFGQRG